MIQRKSVAVAIVMMFSAPLLAESAVGRPNRAGRVAKRCLTRIKHITHKAVSGIDAQGRHCASAVQTLLDRGEVQAAREAASTCVQNIEDKGHGVVQRINATGERCIELLLTRDAPEELVERVEQAVNGAREAIIEHAEMVIRRIRGMFPG